jgi:hypothetical protein
MANTETEPAPAAGIQANLHRVTSLEASANLLASNSSCPTAVIDLDVVCDDNPHRVFACSEVRHSFTLFVDASQHLAVLRQLRDSADAALRAMEEMHQAALEVQP